MKSIIRNLFAITIICSIVISLSSCFTIGAALFVGDEGGNNSFSKEQEKISEGWVKPENRNVLIKLDLSNGKDITGKFKGEEIFKTGKETYQFVLMDSADKIEKVPVKYITRTEILKPKKIGKGTAVFIGFGIDLALTALLLSTVDFDFDLFGSN